MIRPCYVIIGLFEITNISGIALAKLVKPLLAKFQSTNKFLACVKDKGMSLTTLNFALFIVVSHDVLQFEKPHFDMYFGYVMSKVC
jgi:hypothetical protein